MLPSLPAQTCRAQRSSSSSSSSAGWQLPLLQQASCCRRVERADVVSRARQLAVHALTASAALTAAAGWCSTQQQTAGHHLTSSRRACRGNNGTHGSTGSCSRNNAWCCRASAAPAAAAAGENGDLAAAAAAVSTPQPGSALSVGQTVDVRCERIGTGGVGVCLWGDSQLVLLVKGALPGEQLTATITAVKKNFAEGLKVKTLTAHVDAVPPACEHYGTCGGCSLQALSYPAQLAHKVGYVGQMLARVGQLPADAIAAAQQPAVAADAVFGYRNKLQMAFSSLLWQEARDSADSLQGQQQQQQQWQQQQSPPAVKAEKEGRQAVKQSWQGLQQPPASHQATSRVQDSRAQQGFGLGYYLPGSNSIVVLIQHCHLVSDEMNNVVTQVKLLCQQHGLQPHNHPGGHGVLRHLIVRSAATTSGTATAATSGTATAIPPPTPHLPHTPSCSHSAMGAPLSSIHPAVAASAPATTAAGFSSATAATAAAAPAASLMAVLVTTAAAQQQPHTLQTLSTIAQELLCACPGLVSVVHSVEEPAAAAAAGGGSRRDSRSPPQSRAPQRKNPSGRGQRKSSSVVSSGSSSSTRGARPLRVLSSQVLAGDSHLVESMCGLHFQLSPHSFFQTNTAQAEQLYNIVVQAVAEALQRGHPQAQLAAPLGALAPEPARELPAAAAAPSVHHARSAVPPAALAAAADVLEAAAPSADLLLQQVFNDAPGMSIAAQEGPPLRFSGVVLDLYCGTGTIALCLASALPEHHVIGLDVSSSSISDAVANAERNCLRNVTFKCADLDELLSAQRSRPASTNKKQHSPSNHSLISNNSVTRTSTGLTDQVQQHQQQQQLRAVMPEVVVVDPARAGLGQGVVQYLLHCGADRVVYVSCNAATQARDLQALCGSGVFQVASWVCVDLFPHTDVAHVETVVVLDRV